MYKIYKVLDIAKIVHNIESGENGLAIEKNEGADEECIEHQGNKIVFHNVLLYR